MIFQLICFLYVANVGTGDCVLVLRSSGRSVSPKMWREWGVAAESEASYRLNLRATFPRESQPLR